MNLAAANERYETLEENLKELGLCLEQAQKAIAEGALPSLDLKDKITDIHREYTNLNELLGLYGETRTLDVIKEHLDQLSSSAKFSGRRDSAIVAIEPLNGLVHADAALQNEINELLQGVHHLIESLKACSSTDEFEALQPKLSAYGALLELVQSHASLTEDEVIALEDTASTMVSRVIVTASVRGRLLVRDEAPTTEGLGKSEGPIESPADKATYGIQLKEGNRTPPAPRQGGNAVGRLSEVSALLERFPPEAEGEVDPLGVLASVVGASSEEPQVADISAKRTQPDLNDSDAPNEESNRAVAVPVEFSETEGQKAPQRSSEVAEPTLTGKELEAGQHLKRAEATPNRSVDRVEHHEVEVAETPLEAVETGTPHPTIAAHDLRIWEFLGSRRPSLALHLAKAHEAQGMPVLTPSWLVGTLVLGQRLRQPVGELAAGITKVLATAELESLNSTYPMVTRSNALLAAAATLAPSLLAPVTGSLSVLHEARKQLAVDYPRSATLLSVADQFSQRGLPLDFQRLRVVHDTASWEAARQAQVEDATQWLENAAHYSLGYGIADQIWRTWIVSTGILGEPLSQIAHSEELDASAARQLLSSLQDPQAIEDLVRDTDKQIRGKYWSREGIYGQARRGLERNLREALEIIGNWHSHHEIRPDRPQGFEASEAKKLREEVQQVLPDALAEIQQTLDQDKHVIETAAIAYFAEAVKFVGSLFDPQNFVEMREPDIDDLLNFEVALSDLPIDDSGYPLASSRDVVRALTALPEEPGDWREAFSKRLDNMDTLGAQVVLRRLVQVEPGDYEEMAVKLETHRDTYQLQVERRAVEVLRAVESATALGLLTEDSRSRLVATIDSVDAGLGIDHRRFKEDLQRLEAVEAELEKTRTERHQEVLRVLEKLEISKDSDEYKRICSALEENDLVTATEHLYAFEEGREVAVEEPSRDVFKEFFHARFNKIDAVFRTVSLPRIVGAVSRGAGPGGAIDMQRVPKAQAEQAATMLKAWFEAKNTRQPQALQPHLEKVLEVLGFQVESLETSENLTVRGASFSVRTKAIADRNLAPIPYYGSSARGRYQILCLWDRQGEEDIISSIGDTQFDAPLLVFHFGRLTETRRRTIAQLCRERKRSTFVVLDDISILFLCGERGARMPVMYDILLPFTVTEPFTTTAGHVPPEMFYGREDERRSLISPDGSSFVYGGRQLGKTALLRTVERDFHDPSVGRVAVWIDLKREGIGINRKPEDLWHFFARSLKQHGVIPERSADSLSALKIRSYIREYLEQDPARRILFLLDEADKFLESDAADDYSVTAELKGIMDDTERRFKVVLAGLHNVQRTTRQINQPLAHYGDPICIGPLLHNGEVVEARRLITGPLESIGYRFESQDLVTRILALTNYYPSLIQLFCRYLVRHLMNYPFDRKKSPPYVITSDHLEEVYRSRELRGAIFNRFQWTLQLDQRYAIIAYVITLLCHDEPDGLIDGFTVREVREEASTYWPTGSEESYSIDAFSALLDEMIGLGILRSPDGIHYTLRNSNVLALMGSREEIENQLLEEREPPPEFEPDSFRNQITIDGTQWLSALTARQESELRRSRHGVSVIFGAEASDLGKLADSLLESRLEDFIRIEGATDLQGFERELKALINRKKHTTTVVIVDEHCPWSLEWVQAAVSKVRGLRSRDGFVRIAFAASPSTAARLIRREANFTADPLIGTMSLGPWSDAAVRTWLELVEYPKVQKEDRAELQRITGFWPHLLREFVTEMRNSRRDWATALSAMEEMQNEPGHAERLIRGFGIDGLERIRVYSVLHALEEAGAAEIHQFSQLPISEIQAELTLSDLLQTSHMVRKNTFRADPVVGRLAATLVQV